MSRTINVILVALIAGSTIYAEEWLGGLEGKRIAVLNLEAGRHVEPEEALRLTGIVQSLFESSGKFGQIELGTEQTGCALQHCARQAGQSLGVDGVVYGSIGKPPDDIIYVLSLTLIDVATGRTIRTIDERIAGRMSDVFGMGAMCAVDRVVKEPEVEDTGPEKQLARGIGASAGLVLSQKRTPFDAQLDDPLFAPLSFTLIVDFALRAPQNGQLHYSPNANIWLDWENNVKYDAFDEGYLEIELNLLDFRYFFRDLNDKSVFHLYLGLGGGLCILLKRIVKDGGTLNQVEYEDHWAVKPGVNGLLGAEFRINRMLAPYIEVGGKLGFPSLLKANAGLMVRFMKEKKEE